MTYIYIYAFSRRFYPKRLTVHSGYTLSVCVPWELNPQPLHCEHNALPLSHRNIHIAPTVARSAIPPWLFPMPLMDIQLHKEKHNNETSVWERLVVHKYIDLTYYSVVQIYTDGSKDPDSGKTAVVSVYIPLFKIKMSKRSSDHISVFTAVLIALIGTWVDRRNTTNKGSDMHRLSFSTKQFV